MKMMFVQKTSTFRNGINNTDGIQLKLGKPLRDPEKAVHQTLWNIESVVNFVSK